MTEHSPITPPPELVQQWMNEICDDPNGNPQFVSSDDRALAARAAAWGADTELEACCEWASKYLPYLGDFPMPEDKLRAARRPKPPSLKEQALIALDDAGLDAAHENILRRALEALPDD